MGFPKDARVALYRLADLPDMGCGASAVLDEPVEGLEASGALPL